MKKISVVIPVYNVGKYYLEKCINSVINQSYKNIELIVVDDGSTDESPKILDKMAQKDKRIKVYHKKNAGVSAARNYGISKSSGDYITFVDSDDYIDSNMYTDMLKKADEKVDIIASGAFYETENGNIFEDTSKKYKNVIIKDNNISLENIFNGCLGAVIWNKIFRSSLIKENNIKFSESIHSCEDLLFVVDCVTKSKIISYISTSYYHYIKRKESVTNSKFNSKLLTYKDAYKLILEKVKNDIDLYNLVSFSKAINTCNILYKLINTKSSKIVISEYYNDLIITKNSWNSVKKSGTREKTILKLMCFNPYFGTFIWKIYKIIRKIKNKY